MNKVGLRPSWRVFSKKEEKVACTPAVSLLRCTGFDAGSVWMWNTAGHGHDDHDCVTVSSFSQPSALEKGLWVKVSLGLP